MKSLKPLVPFLLLAALIALVAACSAKKSANDPSEQIYTCSMHPQVRHKGPGDCPICGMTLTPLTTATPSASDSHTEPMEVTANATSANAAAPITVDAARSSVSSVKIEAAAPRSLARSVQVFGEIEYISDHHLDFTWYYGGRIEKVLFDYNTTELQKGQPLFEVYSEGAIADQEAYLNALRERYLSTFYERDVLSAKVEAAADRLRQVGFDDEALKALSDKKQVRRTFILRSPINGSIVGDIPHTGERITPEMVLLHLTDLSEVWFVADVFEQDYGALKLGQRITVSSKARPGHDFPGKLVFIDRRIIPEKRTVRARFVIPNPQRELLPQLSATGTLEIALGNCPVTVPASAVIDTGRRKIVYVQTGSDHYEPRDVMVSGQGSVANDGQLYAAIASGVKAGENVVTGGAFLIDAEAQLQGGASSTTGDNSSAPASAPMPPGHQH